MKSIQALNQLMTQAITAALLFAIVMLAVVPASAGNRLVARSCDAAIIAPVYAYTAPACNQNAPLQQRELGGATYDACPQAQAAAAIDYGEIQRYTIIPQVQRYQVQRIQTPRAQKVLFVEDNRHHHHHAQALQNQAHHHAAIRQRQQVQHHHDVVAIRASNRAQPNRTVTKTVTRSSRR